MHPVLDEYFVQTSQTFWDCDLPTPAIRERLAVRHELGLTQQRVTKLHDVQLKAVKENVASSV